MKLVSLFRYRGYAVKILRNGCDVFPFEYKITVGRCNFIYSRTSYTTAWMSKAEAKNEIDTLLSLERK